MNGTPSRKGARWLPGLLLVAGAALVGCGGTTTPVTPATARPGEMGFGAAIQGRYSLFSRTETAAVGQAAMVDAAPPPGKPGDSIWQVYRGGVRLRHCTVFAGGAHACADAELPEPVKSDALVIVDPENLGRSLTVTRISAFGAGGQVFVSGSFDLDTKKRLRATPGHGIWVRRTSPIAPPWHCQVETDGRPRCRSLPADANVVFIGNAFFYEGVLGVFTLKDVSVLWVSRFSAAHRCTASREQPQPVCVAAKMQ